MTAIATTETLEQRLTKRLHESIGDLITDADLKAMVERGMDKALFQPRESSERWGSPRPPLVDALVERFLEAKMQAAVEQWLKDNPDKIDAMLQSAIQKGAGAAFMHYIDSKFALAFAAGVEQLNYR